MKKQAREREVQQGRRRRFFRAARATGAHTDKDTLRASSYSRGSSNTTSQ